MLIALYCLPPPPPAPPRDVTVRKPIGPEHDLVVRWVATNFSAGWASESRVALGNRPPSLFIATRADTLLGFCAYDATARGLVGPIGVAESARGQGVGAALLRGCLDEKRAAGYAGADRRFHAGAVSRSVARSPGLRMRVATR